MTIDLKYVYCNTPMQEYEYMQLPFSMIPQEIVDHYQLMMTTIQHSNPCKKTVVQQIFGCLIYYVVAIDATMLVALGDIASEKLKATRNTRKAVNWLLNYAVIHPDARIRYKASEMALWSHSNASYLSVKYARSHAGAVFFIGQKWDNSDKPLILRSKLNGFVRAICTI